MFLICWAITGSLRPALSPAECQGGWQPRRCFPHPLLQPSVSVPLSGAADRLQSIPAGEQRQSLINTLNLHVRRTGVTAPLVQHPGTSREIGTESPEAPFQSLPPSVFLSLKTMPAVRREVLFWCSHSWAPLSECCPPPPTSHPTCAVTRTSV